MPGRPAYRRWNRAASPIWAVALGAAWLASGCRGCLDGISARDDERPALGKVTVKATSSAVIRETPVALDAERIQTRTQGRLQGSGVFAHGGSHDGKRVTANVAIAIDILGDGDDAEGSVKVHLRIDPRPLGPSSARYAEDTAAVGQVPFDDVGKVDVAAAYQHLAERTMDDLLSAYLSRQQLWFADEKAIVSALASSDGDLRLEAVRIVGTKKLRRELPAILGLLSDDDEATRDVALGAVVAMGDRSAVRALADSHQMRDTYEMRKVLDAVASLGGQEAKDYLAFVNETHDDADIRAMAKAALDRLVKRESSGAPTK